MEGRPYNSINGFLFRMSVADQVHKHPTKCPVRQQPFEEDKWVVHRTPSYELQIFADTSGSAKSQRKCLEVFF